MLLIKKRNWICILISLAETTDGDDEEANVRQHFIKIIIFQKRAIETKLLVTRQQASQASKRQKAVKLNVHHVDDDQERNNFFAMLH